MTPDIDVLFKGDSGTVTLTDYGQLIATGKGKIKSNSAIGSMALNANTTGNSNTATGNEALRWNTTGTHNTATGSYALRSNVSGKRNTATGASALLNNTEGTHNTATGNQALYQNRSGNYNTALGCNALYYNYGGNNNVALGFEAGKGEDYKSKSGGVFLGYQAGKDELDDNKLYIDNSDTTAPLIYGDFEADSLRINGDLEVSGTLKIEGGNPEADKVLASDANGLARWAYPNEILIDTLGLAGVSSASTDATKSTYTMTPDIDVLFKGDSGTVTLTDYGQLIATGKGKIKSNSAIG
ncbi:MAG: hypothetical protein GY834_13825, partial [Bacteroidetes bacterium]|nr:hypothetical protein [Bacteroidota bacterium]